MRGLTGKLLLFLFSALFTAGLLEGAFRLLDLRGVHSNRSRDWDHALLSPKERLPGVWMQFRPNTSFRLDYDSNPRGYFDRDNGLSYRINRHGFRGPDFERRKAAETFRIAVLGDSFTFGEGVKWEDTFVKRLERLLAAGAGSEVEVLNFGVSGWTSKSEVRFLEQAGLDFEPDLVLVVYVLNDTKYLPRLEVWEGFRAAYEPEGVLRHSYFASWVYARVARHVHGQRYVEALVEGALEQRGRWEKMLSELQAGKRIAAEAGAGYAVVIFPFMYRLDDSYPFAVIHRMVEAALREDGIPVLDLFPAFEGESYTRLWVHPSDQHPNDRAHEIAARAIGEFLETERLVEPGQRGF